jgi:hypothetical protein
MTGSFFLATAHGPSIPSPVTILVAVAAVGFVLWSRTRGQPLRAKRLLVLPVVLTAIGATDLSGSLSSTDIAFLVGGVIVSVILGAARGATIEVYPNQGELWQRYRRSTVTLWIVLIAIKVVLLAVASVTGAQAGGGTNTLLVTLGASLLAEAAVVGPRALSTGLPFAADQKDQDERHSRDTRPRSSLAERLIDLAPPPQSSDDWRDEAMSRPATRRGFGPDDAGQWRSPSLRDGRDWLRRRLAEPGGQRPMTRDSSRQRHNKAVHDDHHHHDHHSDDYRRSSRF